VVFDQTQNLVNIIVEETRVLSAARVEGARGCVKQHSVRKTFGCGVVQFFDKVVVLGV